jgi:hypothetical protein
MQKKSKFTYWVSLSTGFIQKFKGDSCVSFLFTATGTWDIIGYPNITKNMCRPINTRVVKFFEQEGGYNPKGLV